MSDKRTKEIRNKFEQVITDVTLHSDVPSDHRHRLLRHITFPDYADLARLFPWLESVSFLTGCESVKDRTDYSFVKVARDGQRSTDTRPRGGDKIDSKLTERKKRKYLRRFW